MNEIIEKEMLDIKDMIYEINGVEVMFDYDLAELYHVETKRINEAVKRNITKFPERFSWLINQNDFKNLEVAKCDLTIKNGNGGRRYDIRVFTEQGVAMLATILKSKEAINTSIQIMDAFVKMRHYINYSNQLLPNRFLLLEDKVDNNTKRIDELFDKFNPKDIAKNYLFFEGELYDAYSVVMTILKKAKKEIIIIDNYAGKESLDILKNVDKKITIVSKNIDDVLKKKYESQYNNVTFINNDSFHDRFIIVDKKKLYSCGASFKDLGKKCFAINEMDNEDFLKLLLMDIKKRHN